MTTQIKNIIKKQILSNTKNSILNNIELDISDSYNSINWGMYRNTVYYNVKNSLIDVCKEY